MPSEMELVNPVWGCGRNPGPNEVSIYSLDQDLINFTCPEEIGLLPKEYNVFPDDTEKVICTVKAEDESVITSGNYERFFIGEDGHIYGHIIDTRTGYPVDDNGLLSVTIIGADGTMCDALSTALFAMGKERALDFCRHESGFEAVFVGSDRKLYITSGISRDVEPSENIDTEVIER